MAELPRHPDSNDDTGIEPDGRSAGSSKRTYAIVAIVIALVVLMVVLHLTGTVGAGTN